MKINEKVSITICDDESIYQDANYQYIKYKCKTENLVKEFFPDRNYDSLLPSVGLRWTDGINYLIELEPTVVNIPFMNLTVDDMDNCDCYEYHDYGSCEYLEEATEHFSIPIPYQLYFIRVDNTASKITGKYLSIFIYFNTKPLESFTDPIYHVPLTNVYASGNVCMGMESSVYRSEPLDFIPKVISSFWSSGFNLDIVPLVRFVPDEFLINRIDKNYEFYDDYSDVLRAWSNIKLEDICSIGWKELDTSVNLYGSNDIRYNPLLKNRVDTSEDISKLNPLNVNLFQRAIK